MKTKKQKYREFNLTRMDTELALAKKRRRENERLATLLSAPYNKFEEGLAPYQHIYAIARSENCLFETLAK